MVFIPALGILSFPSSSHHSILLKLEHSFVFFLFAAHYIIIAISIPVPIHFSSIVNSYIVYLAFSNMLLHTPTYVTFFIPPFWCLHLYQFDSYEFLLNLEIFFSNDFTYYF